MGLLAANAVDVRKISAASISDGGELRSDPGQSTPGQGRPAAAMYHVTLFVDRQCSAYIANSLFIPDQM